MFRLNPLFIRSYLDILSLSDPESFLNDAGQPSELTVFLTFSPGLLLFQVTRVGGGAPAVRYSLLEALQSRLQSVVDVKD
jgi:hypothetical protein